MEIVKVNSEDYGLNAEKANELTVGLRVTLSERELLIKEYDEVSKLELTEGNLPKFKALRLKVAKNRTQGINTWHKSSKEFFLTGGKFVDAIKNKEKAVNEAMESKLMEAEQHFINLELERAKKLQIERVKILSEFVDDANDRDLVKFEEDEFQALLEAKKKAHFDDIKAKEDAKKEAQAKAKAASEAQERVIKENERLKSESKAREEQLLKEKEDREKIAKVESDKREKEENERLEKDAKAKAEAESKAKIESDKQALILKKEREEKAKIESELQAKKDAELKAKEELEAKAKAEKEVKRQAELAPEKEKISNWIVNLEIERLNVEGFSPEGANVCFVIAEKFDLFKAWALNQKDLIK